MIIIKIDLNLHFEMILKNFSAIITIIFVSIEKQ
jgi:hypothetical protein